MQVDVVRHLAVGMILEMELDRVALAHADEAARHRAAESPERVSDAVGDRLVDFDHFELDDDLGRLFAIGRRRHHGGLVRTAFTGSPCGGPRSPFIEPPVGPTRVSQCPWSDVPHAVSSKAPPSASQSYSSS